MSRVLSTCLTRDYVSSWGVKEAVRELVQNALDTENYEFIVDFSDITIKSFGGTIDVKNLLLGAGSKRNDTNSRGGFSEGLLLALLILAREGVQITFINGDKQWFPVFDFNTEYGCETLFIVEEDSDEVVEDGVSIVIELDKVTTQNIIDNTLHLQDDYKKFETGDGVILLDSQHKGKIYVGGLFVDYFKSEYGFDFHPSDFKLDRDRRSLSPFDIQWKIRDLLGNMEETDLTEELSDRIVESIANNDKAMDYLNTAEVGKKEKLINSVEKLYNSEYSGKLVVSDYDEARRLEKAGNKNVKLISNSNLVDLIHKTESYQTVVLGKIIPEEKDIKTLIIAFEDDYGSEMSDEMFEKWEELRNLLNEEI